MSVKHIVTAEHLQSGFLYRQSDNNKPFNWGWRFDDSQAVSGIENGASCWQVAIYTNWQIEHDKQFKRLTSKELTKILAM